MVCKRTFKNSVNIITLASTLILREDFGEGMPVWNAIKYETGEQYVEAGIKGYGMNGTNGIRCALVPTERGK
jgi:hypothetical protein